MKLSKCRNVDCQSVQLPAPRCIHCTKDNFTLIGTETLHDRVRSAYDDARNLIGSRRFDEALALLNAAMQWSPEESGIYFHRLLAKKECASEGELIAHGFDYRETDGDPDFLLAVRFAETDEESAFYRQIVQMTREVHERLTEEETKAFESELAEMREQISHRAPEITEIQSELQSVQQKLTELGLEASDLKTELNDVYVRAESEQQANGFRRLEALRKVTRNLRQDEITSAKKHIIYVGLSAAAQQIDDARDALEKIMKEHPWVEANAALEAQQEALKQEIAALKKKLKNSDEALVQMQEDCQKLQEEYARVEKALREYRFRDALYHVNADGLIQMAYEATGIQRDILRGEKA